MHRSESAYLSLKRFYDQRLDLFGCGTTIGAHHNSTLDGEGGVLTLAKSREGVDATTEDDKHKHRNDGAMLDRVS
jgi:hypothetical protein